MKTPYFFQTLLLVLLMAAGGTFVSCEKPEEPTPEKPQTPDVPITSSDVDIQGTWECVYPEETDEESFLRVTFYENFYSINCSGPYYIEKGAPQWPAGGYFTWQWKANYLINNGKFFLWHNVESEEDWVEIPFYSNIPPTFDVSLHDDTLELECLFTHENCPDLDLPEETHYTFVKTTR